VTAPQPGHAFEIRWYFGDLQGRRLGDVDHLPPLQAGLRRVD
jgi:hypothetical protein